MLTILLFLIFMNCALFCLYRGKTKCKKDLYQRLTMQFKNLLVLTIALSSSLVSTSALALEETFYSPKIRFDNGRSYRVSKCVNSSRFQNPCTRNATNLVANSFCRDKGYKGHNGWQTQDVGWDSRVTSAVYNDRYIDGERWRGWRTQVSSILFNGITCYK